MSIKQTTCPPASGQVVFVCLSRNQCKFTRFVCRLSAGNEEHCGEQYADDPGAEADIFDLAGEELDEDVGDKAERNTIGDIVGERHDRHGHERGNCRRSIAPVDFLDAADHKNAHEDERSGGCTARNERGNGRKEHCDEEHCSRENGGKAGLAAFRDAGGGFNKGGNC